MHLSNILSPCCVDVDHYSCSKTSVFLKLARLLSIACPQLNSQELFEAFWSREQLGSTAIGNGIAIPHVRFKDLTQPKACVLRLTNLIDFGALDKKPIDLIIGLIVPEGRPDDHLKLLSGLVRQFHDPSFRTLCQRAKHQKELYQILFSTFYQETVIL